MAALVLLMELFTDEGESAVPCGCKNGHLKMKKPSAASGDVGI